jgi:hypothetical protein
MSSPEL